MNKIVFVLYRGLNGTNPSAFRIDEDGLSVFEKPLPDYKFNLPIRAEYQEGKKVSTLAKIIEPLLPEGIAEYTPQFGDGHRSIRFPGLTTDQVKTALSKFAKTTVK